MTVRTARLLAACRQSATVTGAVCLMACGIRAHASGFARGADISWVDQLQQQGVIYRNSQGQPSNPLDLLADLGINAVRLRVWVHPSGPWSTQQDLLREAERARAHHMRILVDFHYSDSWADPGKQHKPAAWAHDPFPILLKDVGRFTRQTLQLLKRHGVRVYWVQVGNEINSGLLWPDGHTPHFHRIAALLNSGYTAVKTVYPHAKMVVHLANGYNNADFRWFFDHVRADGAHWDVIGMSLYPNRGNWRRYNHEITANMRDMIDRYHCDVMVSEVGMRWNHAHTARLMLEDLLRRSRAIGPRMLGIFYWEPEAPPGWNGYDKGALDPTGRFTQALEAFRTP